MQYLMKFLALSSCILSTSTVVAVPVMSGSTTSATTAHSIQKRSYLGDATNSVNVLQQNWYSTSTGLWQDFWWNSGSILATIATLASVDGSMKSTLTGIISNTFAKAPGRGGTQAFTSGFISTKATTATAGRGFINGFYDDEGWWAMSWINSYDVTGNAEYLKAAQDIFDDMAGGWPSACKAGIWWDKQHTYVAAIANELFLSVAAHLANRVPEKKSTYLGWAQKEWDWFSGTGIINSNNNINDGLGSDCKNNNGAVWSYNQGVILGGLVELSRATGNKSYTDTANTIAKAAISKLSNDDGIMVDPTSQNPDPNASQFKGIFARYLVQLHRASPSDEYVDFLQRNADSIWANSRDTSTNKLGPNWQGPYVNATAASHGSALDCLVAAAAVS